MNYWLFKSEPDEYSINDLAAEPSGSGCWDGIRNYQARNILRDQVREGDFVFFYHSSCKVPGVAGTAIVTRGAYSDPAQFDKQSKYYDEKSTADKPRWFCVDLSFKSRFKEVVSLKTLKATPALSEMMLLKQGRLSVQPVTADEWRKILQMAKP
ncbi:EVE domain-containing protein [Oceanicoccus sp. KOV_DT_Chl]|uniref:EVE domain-containing protein n=1 Tax=Oceanicoccus sp. KOV_DT_Chl TaxID=1904639 RepID=UPI000C7C187F|nr:EVE domain-containing protein [Oceanicoccus sp. KOV_DT_Chl]